MRETTATANSDSTRGEPHAWSFVSIRPKVSANSPMPEREQPGQVEPLLA